MGERRMPVGKLVIRACLHLPSGRVFTSCSCSYPGTFRFSRQAVIRGAPHGQREARPATQRSAMTVPDAPAPPSSRSSPPAGGASTFLSTASAAGFVCANCQVAIGHQPTFHLGLAFCCAGCAVDGPCICSYDEELADDPDRTYPDHELVDDEGGLVLAAR